jgi:hypothetical protein
VNLFPVCHDNYYVYNTSYNEANPIDLVKPIDSESYGKIIKITDMLHFCEALIREID